MSNLAFTDLGEATENLSFTTKKKKKNSPLKLLFKFYKIAYYQKIPREKSFLKQKIEAVFTTIIWWLQISSLLWLPDLPIEGWKKSMGIWHFIGFLRLDNTCSALGVINFCIYASISTILFNFAFIAILILFHKSIKLPELWISFCKKSLYLLTNFLSIPSIALLVFCLKLNFSSQKNAADYYDNSYVKDFEVSIFIQAFIFLSLILCFIILLADSIFTSDIRHSIANFDLKVKAHSQIDIHCALFEIIFSIFHSIVSKDNIEYFQFSLMVTSILLLIEAMKSLSYFSIFMNCLIAVKYCAVMCVAGIFFFGNIIDRAFLITLFTLTVMPILCVFIVQFLLHRVKNNKPDIPSDLQRIEGLFYAEHCLRPFLCSDNIEFKDKIFSSLGKCYNNTKLHKNKLLVIWEVNYCIFTLNNEALAKIKFSKIADSIFSLEGNYQEYICKKTLSEFHSNESAEYLDYFQKIHDSKLEDEIICTKLLDFWKELVSINPNINILNKHAKMISESIKNLDKEYTHLSSLFPKCKEPLVFYSTFARDILYDNEKSAILEYKIKSIDKITTSSSKDSKSFNYFDDDSGIILASAEIENFGKISFANGRACEILKCPIDDIIENNISSIIPYPYSELFNKGLYNLLQLVDDANLKLPDSFFFALPDDHIIECTGKMSIACFSSKLWFVLIFREKITKRQFAIISSNGDIYAHSKKFAKFAAQKSKNLQYYNISQLFPNLHDTNLQPWKLYPVPSITIETYLAYCVIEFYNIKIPYIILVNDPDEISSWKHGHFGDFQSPEPGIIKKVHSALHLKRHLTVNGSKNFQSEETLNFSQKLHSKETAFRTDTSHFDSSFDVLLSGGIIENEKSSLRSSVKSESLSQTYTLNHIVKLSTRALKIFHIMLVLSMVTAIVTNLIVVFYISSKVKSESNIDVPITLGKLQEVFHAYTFYARAVSVIESLNGPPEILAFSYENYYTQAKNLEELYQNIVSTLLNWKSCSMTIFTDEKAVIWSTTGGIHLEKTNLINIIADFIKNGNDFIAKQIKKEDNSDELRFFSLNGYWQAFRYCNDTLFELNDCVIEEINTLELQMNILLSVGFGILLLCFIIIIPFCLSAIKMENNFWNLIKKNAYINYGKLKQACLDRLINIHERDYNVSDEGKKSKEANLKNYWKYVWRISVYLLIALLFVLFNSLYLYKHCALLLYLRPNLLVNLINTQVLYKNLMVWSSELTVVGVPQSLTTLLANSNPFMTTEAKFHEVWKYLSYSEKKLRDKKYSILLNDEFMKIFYEKTENISNFLEYGTYSAGKLLAIEGSYMDYSHRYDFLVVWEYLMIELNNIDNQLDLLIDLVDTESKNEINFQLDLIIASLVLFVASSLAIYLGCYLPFFSREKKNLERMQSITKLIPNKYIR
ncbi:unnamed protein product [Blepharisma stoltei]|uniref:TmcB/TmcC TPR repeats domain-containing protein n=1 Tax=Blepharisma stoltei TaxID=1481888 RepID=A0AAU9JDA9_9CILI|nr:unnamed protein product [Blepharisma stoltei]